jgi:peptidoglycan/LPS O-acetylase OafA/YrhL
MTQRKQRESNLELLRIVAMVLIIIHHIVVHCVQPELENSQLIAHFDNGYFGQPALYGQLFLVEFFNPLGKAGVAIFMLISGYFLTERGNDIKIGKIAGKLLGHIAFVTVLLTLAVSVYNLASGKTVLIPDTDFYTNNWWFVGYYFAVVFIGRYWLCGWLNRLSKEAYGGLLLALAGLFCFQWIRLLLSFSLVIPTLIAGLFMFALGGYIRKFDPFKKIPSAVLILAFVLLCAWVMLNYRNVTMNAIAQYAQEEMEDAFTPPAVAWSEYHILPILQGLLLFELFRRIRLRGNRVINFLAGASFMVYLVHDVEFVRGIWKQVDFITPLWENPLLFLLDLLKWAAIIYAAGVLAYVCYSALARWFRRLLPSCSSQSPGSR